MSAQRHLFGGAADSGPLLRPRLLGALRPVWHHRRAARRLCREARPRAAAAAGSEGAAGAAQLPEGAAGASFPRWGLGRIKQSWDNWWDIGGSTEQLPPPQELGSILSKVGELLRPDRGLLVIASVFMVGGERGERCAGCALCGGAARRGVSECIVGLCIAG